MSGKKLVAAKSPDAIVVLGGSISPSGEIPDFVKTRIKKAIELSGGSIPIVMSGLWSYLISYTPTRSEASAMKAYALTCDPSLNPDLIKLEEASQDTIGTAYFTKLSFLEPRSWRNIILVTSEFHIARSLYIFQKVLGRRYTITPEATPSGFTAEELKPKAILEDKVLGLTKHFIEPITAGDTGAIRKVMDSFPGYSPHPKYTREDLLQIIDIGVPMVDAYGIKYST